MVSTATANRRIAARSPRPVLEGVNARGTTAAHPDGAGQMPSDREAIGPLVLFPAREPGIMRPSLGG